MSAKYQANRPNKYKPSVVKKHTLWWARFYDSTGAYVAEPHFSQQEALITAYAFAELNREVTA